NIITDITIDNFGEMQRQIEETQQQQSRQPHIPPLKLPKDREDDAKNMMDSIDKTIYEQDEQQQTKFEIMHRLYARTRELDWESYVKTKIAEANSAEDVRRILRNLMYKAAADHKDDPQKFDEKGDELCAMG